MLLTLKFAPLILTSGGEGGWPNCGRIYSTYGNIASSLDGCDPLICAGIPPSLTNRALLTVTPGIISLFIPVLTTNVLLVFTI